jgi:hypothetical protein
MIVTERKDVTSYNMANWEREKDRKGNPKLLVLC